MRAVLLLALVAPCACFFDAKNPMSRVADLLSNLMKKKESDGKQESDLWDRYVCWYKTVVSTKKAANDLAKGRISSLQGYIDDIEGGKIEFTNERASLEKDTKELQDEIDKANELREKENEDFEAAKEEMEKAIASLEKAVEVLGEATKDMKEGVLISMGSSLKNAMDIGSSFVSKADADILMRALNNEVGDKPEGFDGMMGKDAKEMSGKYKARSSKIQEILADMLQTFKDNLDDAKKKESETKAAFETLSESKGSQLKSAQDGLASKNEETGARNLNKQEAQDELDMLKTRVENDEKFIKQADESHKVKSKEWKERCRLRTSEMAAISEALAVLRSDDARDLSKKSMSSQKALFLQESSGNQCARKKSRKAIQILREGAKKHSDLRLSVLASMLQLKGEKRFEKVEKAIDKMVEDLHAEEDEDLETKENCEADRMKNTKVAKKKSQEIDDKTAFISRKNAQIATLKGKIANLVKNIKDLNTQISEAQSMRDAENAEFKVAKGDDLAAKGLVEKTKTVLMKFYEDEGLALVQTKKVEVHVQQAPEMSAAGEAPPPPPPTWQEPYGGSPGEANGIQSILEMIIDDIDKDIRVATEEEDSQQQEFDDYKSTTEDTIGRLEDQKAEYETEVGDKEGDIEVAKGERSDKKKILDETMAYLKTIAPGCDYMAVNFELRKQNRAEEIEGLAEAKASLQGGAFNFLQKPTDDDDCQ